MLAGSIASAVVSAANKADASHSGIAASELFTGATKWKKAKLAGNRLQPIRMTRRHSCAAAAGVVVVSVILAFIVQGLRDASPAFGFFAVNFALMLALMKT